jgi:hypothetical protein
MCVADNTSRFVLVHSGIRMTWDGIALQGHSRFRVGIIRVLLPLQSIARRRSIRERAKKDKTNIGDREPTGVGVEFEDLDNSNLQELYRKREKGGPSGVRHCV